MIPLSPCDLIPSSQVIAAAKMWLGISTSNYDGFFRIQIENCLKKFYSPAVYEFQHKIVDICDNSVKIPAGSRKVMGIAFCNDNGCNTETGEIFATNFNYFFLSQWLTGAYPAYGSCTLENMFVVQDGYYNFVNETDETLAIVYYWGYRTDENGLVIIPEYYESCLTNFLGYCYLKKNPLHIKDNPYATANLRDTYFRDYRAEKLQILGNEKKIQFDEQKHALRFASYKMQINDLGWSPFYNNTYQ